jgi:Leucine-rich repeat (LRR) protein
MENCSLITELPDTVGQLKYLERLILSGCENLTILPNAIVNLTKLEILMLNGCSNLKHLPKELGRLLNLVELHLTCCNKLHELPSSMVGMRMLKELHLQWTPVENLPEDFDQLTNLRTLFMSHLIKLPPRCEGFGSLVILDLANCKLEGSLPSSFGAFVALKTLNLQSNNVVAVEAALEEINLAGCISVIQSGLYIMHNRALRTCFLSGSKVAVKYDNAWSEVSLLHVMSSIIANSSFHQFVILFFATQ